MELTVAIKFVLLQPYDRKYLSLKNRKRMHFLNRQPQDCQPLAAPQNLDPAGNCKPYK